MAADTVSTSPAEKLNKHEFLLASHRSQESTSTSDNDLELSESENYDFGEVNAGLKPMYSSLLKSLTAKAESLLALEDNHDEGVCAWWERTMEETLSGGSALESKMSSESSSNNGIDGSMNLKRLSCFQHILEEEDDDEEEENEVAVNLDYRA